MKILSISDVITNSSSEVFVMRKDDAEYYYNLENNGGCVDIEKIDYDWILDSWEHDLVIYMCGLDKSEVSTFVEDDDVPWYIAEYHNNKKGYWEDITQEDWKAFCELHKDKIMELVNEDLYFVDIEDHFDDAFDVIESARDDSLWSDNRH